MYNLLICIGLQEISYDLSRDHRMPAMSDTGQGLMVDMTDPRQGNWGIIGHEWAVDMLRQRVAGNTQRHAYLVTGPSGVGRRTLAIRFAQALNCPKPLAPGEPCRVCQTCSQIERMLHPDLMVIQAEKIGGILKVDQIRAVQHTLALSPYAARYRVALFLRFEEANQSAMNALLKTLEEPPASVILVLTAGSAEWLAPTITSRCEILRLRPVPLDKLQASLQELLEISPDEARLLAHLSNGRPGFALNIHKHPDQLQRRKKWLDDHLRLISADRIERFGYADEMAKNTEENRLILSTWLSFWRDVMLIASGMTAHHINLDYAPEIVRLAREYRLATATRSVNAIEQTIESLDRNINTRLALEVLMLNLPGLQGV